MQCKALILRKIIGPAAAFWDPKRKTSLFLAIGREVCGGGDRNAPSTVPVARDPRYPAWVTLRRLRCRGRVDHPADFGDLVSRETAALGVLLDDRLVLCEVDAKGLVGGDVALDPLNIRAELLQRRVRFLRGVPEGLPFGAADRRKLAFDDELAHGFLPIKSGGS